MQPAQLFALRKTWAFARQVSPFYRQWLTDLHDNQIGLDTLRALPILTRGILAEHHLAIYGERSLPKGMFFTGGTTGQAQIVFVTGEELELRATFAAMAGEEDTANNPLILVTSGGSQGSVPANLAEQRTISVPLRSRAGYEWAWRMLVGEHRYSGTHRRITQVLLPLPAIKKLINFIAEQRLNTSELSLQVVSSYSSYLSRGWRRRIEATLNAKIVDCYGFTEAPVARALECAACGRFHLPETLITEYLSLDGSDPIEAGTGRLCVTTLYPQTQGMILFRYDPGDIVDVGQPCPMTGVAGFLPKGRVHQAARIEHQGRTIYPVFATDVQEAIDMHHWVARSANLRHSGVTCSEDDSWPKWRLSTQPTDGLPRVSLEVELTSSPAFFEAEWIATRESFRRTILAENPLLDRLVREGALEFAIEGLPPGSISESAIIRC